jgi:hypothetical protein
MASSTGRPGRSCPRHYRYAPEGFARAPDLKAESLYVVGGLYGNPHALEALLARSRKENATLVFNGDFNWFNVDAGEFSDLNEKVLRHVALRGNVETEIAGEDTGAGCGCGYPEWVGDAEVERSNEILLRLRETARGFPLLRARLGALPMHLVAEVGGTRIGIVHGDAESLAGWQFSQEFLSDPPARLRALIDAAAVDVFASSHTCLPVMQAFDTARGRMLLANNGAAGMPNFAGEKFGLITRIATRPSPDALYGDRIGAAWVEAVPLRYDHDAWIENFDRTWPAGSPASLSYRKRMVSGPAYQLRQAARSGAKCSGSEGRGQGVSEAA